MAQPNGKLDVFSSEQMINELYSELKRLAAAKLARLPPGQTLQATALLHEAWLRVSDAGRSEWQNRGHFFAAAAEAMRRVLVDQARRKSAQRRAGNALRVELEDLNVAAPQPEERLLAVHAILDEFARENPVRAEIVKLRFFAGLNHHEIAALLDISEKTARRHWNSAKEWLYGRITQEKS